MSPEFPAQAFESFAQEHAANTYDAEGTGLGLSIARNPVEMMGGSIALKSTLGKGTLVTVRLRCSRFRNLPRRRRRTCGACPGGLEAARAIRASGHAEAGTIPIIAMTANAFADDVEKSRHERPSGQAGGARRTVQDAGA